MMKRFLSSTQVAPVVTRHPLKTKLCSLMLASVASLALAATTHAVADTLASKAHKLSLMMRKC